MALNNGQANAVNTLAYYLSGQPRPHNSAITPEQATKALEILIGGAYKQLSAGMWPAQAAEVIAAVEQLRADLAAYRLDTRHIIDLRADGWTIQHPMACRPNLFACPVNTAAGNDLDEPPSEPGQFYCDTVDGCLVIEEAVSDGR